MKFTRPQVFIVLSSLALLVVLIIQVKWMVEAARLKEEFFKEKAGIVLTRTAEVLSADKEMFKHVKVSPDSSEIHKIDSLLHHFMKVYHIHLDYYFEVQKAAPSTSLSMDVTNYLNASQEGCYTACVGDSSSNNLMELKLSFPKQEQYILAEMRLPFITSVILILLVLFISQRTIRSLMKEKRISDHTTAYLNNMTHEFKTPLTNIGLAGKMILRDVNAGKEEKTKQYTEIILEENEKLHHQVEQVLSMTALERGEIPVSRTETDLHTIISNALQRFRLQIEHRNGKVQLALNAQHSVIMGDNVHLINAIGNLFDNAIKYSPEEVYITVTTENVADQIRLSISDKGKGIEKSYHEKVFESYFRVPSGNVHDVKGFGLGLAYVKKIVALHEGNITLTGKKGEGTTITITLPNA